MTRPTSITLPERYYDPKHMGWGYTGWIFLHAIADSFSDQPSADERKAVELMFNYCLPKLLPCSLCSAHLLSEVSGQGTDGTNGERIDSSSGEKLSKWLYRLHNKVNVRTGKKELSMEECQREQEFQRSVKWEVMFADFKLQFDKLCSGVPLSEVAGAGFGGLGGLKGLNVDKNTSFSCAHVEKKYDFRRTDNFGLSTIDTTTVTHAAAERKKLLLFIIIVMLTSALFLILAAYINLLKKHKTFLKHITKPTKISITTTPHKFGNRGVVLECDRT